MEETKIETIDNKLITTDENKNKESTNKESTNKKSTNKRNANKVGAKKVRAKKEEKKNKKENDKKENDKKENDNDKKGNNRKENGKRKMRIHVINNKNRGTEKFIDDSGCYSVGDLVNYWDPQIMKTYPNVKFIFCGQDSLNKNNILYFYACILIEYKYFKTLFGSGMKESQTKDNFFEININDFDIINFNIFINILYTGDKTLINIDNAIKLFIISDKYDVQFIKNECYSIIAGYVNECINKIIHFQSQQSQSRNSETEEIKIKIGRIIGIFELSKIFNMSDIYDKIIYVIIDCICKKIMKLLDINDIINIFTKYILDNPNDILQIERVSIDQKDDRLKYFKNEKLFTHLSWWFNNKIEQKEKNIFYEEINNKNVTILPDTLRIEMFCRFFNIKDKKIWECIFKKMIYPYLCNCPASVTKDEIYSLFSNVAKKYLLE